MNILITGSSGYLANFFIKEFLKGSHNILTISLKNPLNDSKALNLNELNSDFAVESLTNFKPTHVIHFAGLAHKIFSSNDIDNYLFSNFYFSRYIASIADFFKVKQFIFISSIGVFENHINHNLEINHKIKPSCKSPYGVSKLKMEYFLKDFTSNKNLKYTIIRPPLVIGPNPPGNLKILLKALKNNLPIPYNLFKKPKKFIAIDNLSSFIFWTLDNELAFNRTFNICDDKYYSVSEIVSKISKIQNLEMRYLPFSNFLAKVISNIPFLKIFYRKLERELLIDDSYTKKFLKWNQPYDLMDCLEKYFSIKKE